MEAAGGDRGQQEVASGGQLGGRGSGGQQGAAGAAGGSKRQQGAAGAGKERQGLQGTSRGQQGPAGTAGPVQCSIIQPHFSEIRQLYIPNYTAFTSSENKISLYFRHNPSTTSCHQLDTDPWGPGSVWGHLDISFQ